MLHDLGRGAVIGEIALLSDRMRSATVRAVRDSDLFLLRTASFKALIEQNPGFLAQMARLLIERLLAVDRPQPHAGNRAIAVAPAGRDPAARESDRRGAGRAAHRQRHHGPAR